MNSPSTSGSPRDSKPKAAQQSVARAIDRMVWYAGWTDKIAQILGSSNPVAGPFFNFSVPVPSGVVAVLSVQDSSLEGFVDAVLAPISVGNAVVAVASERRPTPAVLLGEMTATADFPGGVLNIVTGFTGELAPILAAHEDVDGIDLAGVDEAFADELAPLPPDRSSAFFARASLRDPSAAPARFCRDVHRVAHDRAVVANPYELAERAADELREQSGVDSYDVAIVLGSGWKEGAVALGEPTAWSTLRRSADSLRPPSPGTVARFSRVRVDGIHVALVAGRVHLYEGHGAHEVVHPVRTVIAAGARTIVLTNAAGGLDPSIPPGTGRHHSRSPQLHRDLAPGGHRRRPTGTAHASST